VLLGVITPGWWWWRWNRGTDAPLRVVGLGAGLLGPICSLLALLGGLRNERPISVTQPTSPLLLRPPGATWGGGTACSPFALVQGAGGHGGISTGSHTDGLGTPSRCTRDPDPAEGVPAAGLANRHAAVIEGRQRGQDRRPQAWVITERRDWGSIRDLGTKVSLVTPHQEFQLVPGQIGTRPALDPIDAVRAGEPVGQVWPLLQRRDPALQEIADHMHSCQAARGQDLDPVQYRQELWREGWLGPPLLAVEC
jgi:hypothetical protein